MKQSTILRIFILIVVVANVIYYLCQWGGDTMLQYVSNGLPVLCSFVAVLCLFRTYNGFQQRDHSKTAWLMVFFGIFLYFLAETTYAVLEIAFKFDMNEYYPSVADYFWCGGYIPILIGLGIMLKEYKKSGFPMGNRKLYIALAFGIIVLFIVMTKFLLIPIVTDTETTALKKVFYLIYPVFDIILVIPSIVLMYITSLFGGSAISKPWKYLSYGFICMTIADMLYGYLGWQDLYGNGNLIDVIWNAGYLIIGLAGLYQRELVESLKKG